jgi:hypothetical protein
MDIYVVRISIVEVEKRVNMSVCDTRISHMMSP